MPDWVEWVLLVWRPSPSRARLARSLGRWLGCGRLHSVVGQVLVQVWDSSLPGSWHWTGAGPVPLARKGQPPNHQTNSCCSCSRPRRAGETKYNISKRNSHLCSRLTQVCFFTISQFNPHSTVGTLVLCVYMYVVVIVSFMICLSD